MHNVYAFENAEKTFASLLKPNIRIENDIA